LVDFLPVHKEMCRLYVDRDGEVYCVLYCRGKASIDVELVKIANDNGAVTRSWKKVSRRHVGLY
jgi:hypothetical protein